MTWLTAAMIVLAAPSAEPTVLQVVVPPCPETWLPTDALLERIRPEVLPLGISEVRSGPLDAELAVRGPSLLLQAPDCGEALELRVLRPGFTGVERRAITLGALSEIERARLVAFVVAEMLSTKPAEVPPPKTEAPPSAPLLGRSRLSSSLGAESFPTNRAAPVNLLLSLERDVGRWFAVAGGIRGRFGVVSTDAGQVSTGAATARLAGSFVATSGDLRLLAGAQVETGWLRVTGHTTEFDVQPRTRDAWTTLAGVHARMELVLRAQVSLFAAVEASVVLAGLEARATGTPAGGLGGAGVGASVGFSWRWALEDSLHVVEEASDNTRRSEAK